MLRMSSVAAALSLAAAAMSPLSAAPAPASPAVAPAAAGTERAFKLEMVTVIKEKPYKFFVITEPVQTTASLEYGLKLVDQNHEISVKSMHFTWKTTGLDLEKTITPDQVAYRENKQTSVQWVPGTTKKGEVNPLDVFQRPIGYLTPGGRDLGVVTRSPDKFVKFSENFVLGKAVLLHRPPLPAGELKDGQTFTTDTDIPDPTYSGVAWTVNVQWTIEKVTGKGDDVVIQLNGVAAATREKAESRKGPLTDGTMSLTSTVKLKGNGELIDGDSRLEVRWKKDPSGQPNGVMDYAGDSRIHEAPLESK